MGRVPGRVPRVQHCARTLPDLFRPCVPYSPRVRDAGGPCYRAALSPWNYWTDRELRRCYGRTDVTPQGSRAGPLVAQASLADSVSSPRGERAAQASGRWCFRAEGSRIEYMVYHIASTGLWMRGADAIEVPGRTDLPGSTRRVERI